MKYQVLFFLMIVTLGCSSQTKNTETLKKISLNGTWAFNSTPEDLFWKKQNLTGWDKIEVPGEWTMQGFKVKPGTQAAYSKEFTIPVNWKNRSIYLKCDAVFSKAKVWINGQEAGEHTGPMIAFEKEISQLIKYGKLNRITIGIVAETLADTLMSGTQYAAHQLGGILRKIYLYQVPKVHLTDLSIQTDFDEEYKNSKLKINARLLNKGSAKAATVSVMLYKPDGDAVSLNNNKYDFQFNEKKAKEVNLNFDIKNPIKWDAEHPNLYKLEIIIDSEKGTEKITKSIGFREIKVNENQLFVNGEAIKLKGVNRHEVHPLLGRSLNPELWEQDARLYKEANINYIRTSHYPPSEEFIEWCDKLGLYVELENPLSWVGHGANEYWTNHDPHNPDLYPYLESISNANISFFRNHPSIIMWSMVNESAWGPNWAKLADFYAKKDPTRPATFHDQAYGGYNNHGSTAMPIANMHYPGTKGPSVAEDFPRPLLFGEYAHLNTYNRTEIATDPGVRDSWGRGFKKMWEGMYKSHGCLGGAIWSGIDDVFYLPDGRVVGYGEWGPIDGWRRKKPEYFHIKKTYSPVKIHNLKIDLPVQGKGINLQIENRFDFTNLNECKINWKLENEQGKASINLAPHKSGTLSIYPKSKNIEGKLLNISIISPQGLEVEKCFIEIGHVKRNDFPFRKPKPDKLQTTLTKNILLIQGNRFSWKFDLESGKIVDAESNGNKIISDGAELMVLSLTSGECKTEHNLDIPVHNTTCTNWKAKSIKWTNNNDTIIISVKASYSEAQGKINYRFSNNGVLEVSYKMKSKIKINPRQWGLVFNVPTELKNLQWYRKALWTYYPDNHIGRTIGSTTPFNSKVDQLKSIRQKPENDWCFDANKLGSNDFRSTKENIYWAALTNDNGTGLTVISDAKHAFRSFVNGNGISFLVADYSTGGGDIFFSAHYADERRELKKGSLIQGSVKIQLVEGIK